MFSLSGLLLTHERNCVDRNGRGGADIEFQVSHSLTYLVGRILTLYIQFSIEEYGNANIEWDYLTLTLPEEQIIITNAGLWGLDTMSYECKYGRIPEIMLHTCEPIEPKQYDGDEKIEVVIHPKTSSYGWSMWQTDLCGEVDSYGVNEVLEFVTCDEKSQLQIFYAFPNGDYTGM